MCLVYRVGVDYNSTIFIRFYYYNINLQVVDYDLSFTHMYIMSHL